MAETRSTQVGVYVPAQEATETRSTQVGVYVPAREATAVRATQVGLYVDAVAEPEVRISQVGMYVLAYDPDAVPTIGGHIVNSRTIDLTWVDHGDPGDSYEVEYSLNGTDWLAYGTFGAGIYTDTHSFLSPVTTYYYRVRAVRGGTPTDWSAAASYTTPHPLSFITGTSISGVSSPRTLAPAELAQLGDIVFLHVVTASDVTPVVPGDWTPVPNGSQSGTNGTYLYYKVVTVPEPASFEVSVSSGNLSISYTIFRSDTRQILAIVDSATQVNASGNRVFPSVTSTGLGTMMAMFASLAINTASTPPSSSTEIRDVSSASARMYAMYEPITPAGATGTRTATGTSSENKTTSVLIGESIPGSPPAAPTDLMVTGRFGNRISLSWTDNSGDEAGFELWYREPGALVWTYSNTTLLNATSGTVTGLAELTEYEFRVRAVHGGGGSSFITASATTTATILMRDITLLPQTEEFSRVFSKPSWAQVGDLLILAISTNTDRIVETTPVGWSMVQHGGPEATNSQHAYIFQYRVVNVEPEDFTIEFMTTGDAYSIGSITGWYASDGSLVVVGDSDSALNPYQPLQIWPSVNVAELPAYVMLAATGTTQNTMPTPSGFTAIYDDYGGSGRAMLFVREYGVIGETGEFTSDYVSVDQTCGLVVAVLNAVATETLPTTPTGFAATAYDEQQINLAWIGDGTEAYFEIERSDDFGGTWAAVGSMPNGVLVYSDVGLATNTFYRYRLRAVNSAGASAWTVASAITPSAILLRGAASVVSTVTLSRNVPVPAGVLEGDFLVAGIGVYRGDLVVPDGWELIASAVGDNLRIVYILTRQAGASEPSTYTFTATANPGSTEISGGIAAWYSASGLPLHVGTFFAETQPAMASNTFPSVSNPSIPAWVHYALARSNSGISTDNPVDGEHWDLGNQAYNYLSYKKQLTVGDTPSDISITPTTTVIAGVITFTVNEDVPTIAPPDNFAATAIGGKDILLTWNEIVDSNLIGYDIEWTEPSMGYWAYYSTIPPATSFTAPGFTSPTEYSFRIRSRYAWEASDWSPIVSVVPFTGEPLDPPIALTATPISPTRIFLEWTETEFNLTSYNIQRSLTGVGDWSPIGTPPPSGGFLSLSLSPSTTYYYRVRSRYFQDISEWSAVASATTLAEAEPEILIPPYDIHATAISADAILIDWDNPGIPFDFIDIEWSPNGTDTWAALALLSGGSSFQADGLEPSTAYYFRLATTEGAEYSAWSAVVSATTLAEIDPPVLVPPYNVVATALSTTSISLVWENPTVPFDLIDIEMYDADLEAWASIEMLASGGTFQVDDLVAGTEYSFRLALIENNVYSSWSEIVSATTESNPSAGGSTVYQKLTLGISL